MNSEHDEQVTIFSWAALQEKRYPQLKFMFSTLNGVRLTIGQARKAKSSGNKRGVPDIVLPVKNDSYNGLWIELKVGKNRPSKEQKEYISFLNNQGYYAKVVYGASSAIKLIIKYLKNEPLI